jgi:phage/plasmid primase-like uncharacterized protein
MAAAVRDGDDDGDGDRVCVCVQRLMEMRTFFKEKQLIKRITNLEKTNEGTSHHTHSENRLDAARVRGWSVSVGD